MRYRVFKFWRARVAYFAMCFLVLQAFFAAAGMGAASFSPDTDAFGNPLCISMHPTDEGPRSDNSHTGAMCCTAACTMFVSVDPNTDPVAVFFTPRPGPDVHAQATFDPRDLKAPPPTGPGNPRSPPLA